MGTAMPVLETERLVIRPFVMDDLDALHYILDLEAQMEPGTLEERREWLEWSIRNYAALDRLNQPPFGDRAIMRQDDSLVVGVCGLVPALGPFGLLPAWRDRTRPGLDRRFVSEMGLFWALGNDFRGRGYATEAARALVDYAFGTMNMARIVATTEHTNLASQKVMDRLGMRIEKNPFPDPPWFQVVGVLENG